MEKPISFAELLFVTLTMYHTTLQTSQDFSRIFKNGKESKMDETNSFVIKIDVMKRRFCPQEPHCYKKAKKIYGISWVLYFLQ